MKAPTAVPMEMLAPHTCRISKGGPSATAWNHPFRARKKFADDRGYSGEGS